MIAARQIAFGKAAGKKWVNPYLMDDLYIQWDAEWNAGGGVHDDNYRMIDLSGNGRDITLPDSAIINSDNIVFTNNTGAYINRPKGDFQNFTRGWSVAGTVDVSEVDKSDSRNTCSFFGMGDNCAFSMGRSSDGYIYLVFSNTLEGLGSKTSRVDVVIGMAAWLTLEKIHLVGVSDIANDISSVYVNGVKRYSVTGAGLSGDQYNHFGRNGFGIGCSAGFGRPKENTNGTKYFNALFFNRGLTEDEAMRLFEIDNERFGITL
jgi:hypothetical protein